MLYERYECLNAVKNEIEKAIEMIVEMYYNNGKLLLCGNGGSCADCDHIVGELMKGFTLQRKLKVEDVNKFKEAYEDGEFMAENLQYGIQAISLPSQTAVCTAFLNDVEPSMLYAQLAYAYARPNDVLIGLSTSGNSKNVVNAVKAAKIKGIKTIGFTGAKESKLSELCDITIKVPETETYKVQELHLPVYHYICECVEKRLFD